MAVIALQWDDSEFLLRMRKGESKVVYGAVNVINRTLVRGQMAVQVHVDERYMVRKREFVMRQAAYISPQSFASVPRGQLWGEVAVGQKPRLLLAEFEHGGTREPFAGKNVAVPVVGEAARPSWSESVRPEFTFTSLSIVKTTPTGEVERTKSGRARRQRVRGLAFRRHETRFGLIQFKGARRTFILAETEHLALGGVFQRIGPKAGDIRLLYSFVPPFHMDDSLEFVHTVTETAQRWMPEELQQAMIDALQHEAGRAA